MAQKTAVCLLCGEPMEIYASGNGKPYLDCFGCGVQVFIRRNSSVAQFDKQYGTDYKKHPSPTAAKQRGAPTPPTPPPPPPPPPAKSESPAPKPADPAPAATPKKRGGLIIEA